MPVSPKRQNMWYDDQRSDKGMSRILRWAVVTDGVPGVSERSCTSHS